MRFFQSKVLRNSAILIALISPFALFSSRLQPYFGNHAPVQYLQELVYPIQYVWNAAQTAITLHWQRLEELNRASLENIKLRQQNEVLKLQQIRFEEVSNENAELRKTLDFKLQQNETAIAVEIYGTKRQDPFQIVRINRGSVDQVEAGMPVVTPDGVLGKVIRVGLKHSDVQILTDANFHLDVLIQRTRTRAILQGTGDGGCKLKIHNRSQVKIGDTVVTSGVVGAFPKGIPVGTISKISYGKDYVSQSIEITPWVKPFNLEYALVIQRHDEDIDRIVESTSAEWLETTTSLGTRKSGG